jgi:hypothetical protein
MDTLKLIGYRDERGGTCRWFGYRNQCKNGAWSFRARSSRARPSLAQRVENHPRRISPSFGRTPLALMIAEDGEAITQLIEFLTLTLNRRIR